MRSMYRDQRAPTAGISSLGKDSYTQPPRHRDLRTRDSSPLSSFALEGWSRQEVGLAMEHWQLWTTAQRKQPALQAGPRHQMNRERYERRRHRRGRNRYR